MNDFTVTFLPGSRRVAAARGETIMACAIRAGLYLNASCGGDGACGRCVVIVKKGSHRAQYASSITAVQRRLGATLACCTAVEDDLEVEVPPSSLIDLYATAVTGSGRSEEVKGNAETPMKRAPRSDAFITKIFLKIPAPTLDDRISDLERVERQIEAACGPGPSRMAIADIRTMGALLRESGWEVTVSIGRRDGLREILRLEPGDTSARNYAFVFDIGTTTVSGQLIDLHAQTPLSARANYNRQASYGADVISRIMYAARPDGLEALHAAVTGTINGIIDDLATAHRVSLNDVMGVLVAGNTTMIHLLLKIDPGFIRREPYVPTANFVPVVRASDAGVR
ncbi:MAG: 2Fe-2S iron-sulfur cluster-binding protein, partial [Candidatus Omnitrophota bacterium]